MSVAIQWYVAWALFAVIEEGRRDHPTDGMPWAVLEGLAALVPCDELLFPEVSVATVRKHMEHIFDRTGVRTRTAAAALMIPYYCTTPDRPRLNPATATST
jgi:hypothetical protein